MCMGPEVALAAGLAGAGTGFDMLGQSKTRKAQGRVADRYRRKNRANQRAATGEAEDMIGRYEPAAILESLGEAESERAGVLDIGKMPGLEVDYTGAAPREVKQNIGRQINEAVGQGRKESADLGRLKSYTDTLFNIQQENARPADMIGMYGDFTRGDQRSMGLEMDEASRAGKGMHTIADLFKGAGQMANLYHATGTPLRPAPTWQIPSKRVY